MDQRLAIKAAQQKDPVKAITRLILPIAFASIMFATLSGDNWLLYAIGQLFGGIFFAQMFILQHEFGHFSFFRSKTLNTVFGHITSVFTWLPFNNWHGIHRLHHVWGGWRDKDPTSEGYRPMETLQTWELKALNFCWKFYVPVFPWFYRFGIFWNRDKLLRHLGERAYKKCVINMWALAILYAVLLIAFPIQILMLIPAMYIGLLIAEFMSLSQHSHIPMPEAGEEKVRPMKGPDQIKYSRSLVFPKFISEFILFNFNYHEAHHAYSGVPCYHLPRVNFDNVNCFEFWDYFKKVKSMKGSEYTLTTSDQRDGF